MPSPPADRTLLGLPLRDALLVLIVALTIAVTIAAFAARILGAPSGTVEKQMNHLAGGSDPLGGPAEAWKTPGLPALAPNHPAGRLLGHPAKSFLRGPSLERVLTDDTSVPVSTLGGTPDEFADFNRDR